MDDYRVVSTNTDIIFEKRNSTNYTRVCLPGLDIGFVDYIKKFCNFYKCNFSKDTFDKQVDIYKPEANKLFKSSYADTIVNKAYLHRKIGLCNIGLEEDWHSPVFVVKSKSNIIATTGHNKIYATALRRKSFNMDFDCFVMDFDNDLENKFINVHEIHSNDEFSDAIGYKNFAIDVSVEKTVGGFLPCVVQFSKEYPINYHDGSHLLTDSNRKFFDIVGNKNDISIDIVLNDTHDSKIFDSSGIFNIVQTNTLMTFTTNKQIYFDLSDLLPFFSDNTTDLIAIDGSYIVEIFNSRASGFYPKKSPPSAIL